AGRDRATGRRPARARARHGEPRRAGRRAHDRDAEACRRARRSEPSGDGDHQAALLSGGRDAVRSGARGRARSEPADEGIPEMRPLEHVTILDLSRVLACPFASMILAELGAKVIKVEQPNTGDETRTFEPFVERGDASESAYYLACNRSKESITVNLRSPEGQQVIRALARTADVFIENFPVGTLKRYGLDDQSIRAVNERLVYVSCTGFGQTGPYAHRKGYDTVFQAMGGIMSLTGERGGPPVKPGLPVADLTSGLWLAIAILAALNGRAVTGQGGSIDFSMIDGQVALLTLAAARYFALGHGAPGPRASGGLRRRGRRVPPHHRERPALGEPLQGARPRSVGKRVRARRQLYACAPPRGGDGEAHDRSREVATRRARRR